MEEADVHNPIKIRHDFSFIAFILVYFCVMVSKNNFHRLLLIVVLLIAGSVVLGAFGAHWMKNNLSIEKLAVYQTACQYLTVHSIGLLLVLVINITTNYRLSPKAIYSLFIGILVFCTSLYLVSLSELLAFEGLVKFGIVAPVGGLLLILGYTFTAIDIYKSVKK